MAVSQLRIVSLALSILSLSALTQATSHSLHERLHLNSLLHRQTTLVTPANSSLPGTWSYQGCYTDSVGSRTLQGATYNGNTVTDEACVTFCDQKGFTYAGTEYAGQCYCDNTIISPGAVAASADCNMACTGNASEACGGSNRLTLFYSGVNKTVTGPVVNPGPPGWKSLGCYNDSVGSRTLLNNPQTPGGTANLSIALCTQACGAGGYNISGSEYGGECFCGSTFSNYGAPASDGSIGCNMVCNGNSSEYCGGSNRLNVYATPYTPPAPTGWKALGCYTDSQAARTLNTTEYLNAAMTWEVCTTACKTAGFTYAGLEYADECYCGNALQNGGALAPDGNALCNMACNGNSLEICGGPNRLNLFQYNGTGAAASSTTSSTSSSPTTSTTTSTTPSTTGTAGNSTLPAGWKYRGCYTDNSPNGRAMAYQQPDSSTLTIESCVTTCRGLGYAVAGAEYGVQCFCDNFVRYGASLTADTDCNMACGGNSSEYCGAGNRLSIYSNATLQVYQPPAAQKTGLPGNWTYQGCLTDVNDNRTFPYQIEFANNNTATNCLNLCAEFGYGAGGMEYGEQCFCGDQANIAASPAVFAPDSDCNMACTGNASYLCGSGNRISFYNWTGTTPLTSWDFKTGDAAGEYQFLIGGPIIPLVSTVGINNKVTFVEKWGTEPANNSTGAYELDLTQLNNYTEAWRPMHVKTDVFCSASLTLPDKVGRQINIGGWANDATYGVRLYWPDGSAGVWGVRDWQENVEEVSLLVGRWYPTAMIMANGSILVVGGEAGSNGAAVPSLEIVPAPPGVTAPQYCDYLARTDPYNLYPFLAVLPSGGVFIAYYNEARILDDTSLQTKQTLPNIPGAVNDFLAGRSYPMEGTAVLLPQKAPYTDPLTIMICGGSTIGPEIALDNCVSLQPEVTNANWTIERMPSQRVISSMVALPDGTYLIVNGGQQGFAGFGLATNPNHNAVLYDPSKPLHARMSVMANTTIDRLYHSEAVLLQDGRVLVSGSDPEDVRYVQEYRVEVFIPPYLMGTRNATRPTYTITGNTTNLAYGQSITLSVAAPATGSVSGMKASLLGAVSSTHGNSMGQRTIFPATSCTGSTCTVTMPPNAHVCPPGWFQMFVLDSQGTPSVGQWVRIGGDPAKIGNWPAGFADFDVPGV